MIKLESPFKNDTLDRSYYRLFDEISNIMSDYTSNDFKTQSVGLINNPDFLAYLDSNPVVTMIMDYPGQGYFYISENMKAILGHDREEFYKYGLQKTLTIFPLDQSETIIQKIFPRMFEYFALHAATADACDLRISFPSKVIHADGRILWYLHQLKVLHTDEQHKPVVGLKIITDISDYKKDEVITLKISKKDSNGVFQTIFTESFLGEIPYVISQREKEILQLIDQGKSSQEIGETLFISTHTVNTHRRNMLKKLESKTTLDMLRKASVHGII